MKFILVKGNGEYKCASSCCASWTSISNMWIFVLEITTVDLFMDFLLPVSPQNVALILKLITSDWKLTNATGSWEIHYRMYTVTLS